MTLVDSSLFLWAPNNGDYMGLLPKGSKVYIHGVKRRVVLPDFPGSRAAIRIRPMRKKIRFAMATHVDKQTRGENQKHYGKGPHGYDVGVHRYGTFPRSKEYGAHFAQQFAPKVVKPQQRKVKVQKAAQATLQRPDVIGAWAWRDWSCNLTLLNGNYRLVVSNIETDQGYTHMFDDESKAITAYNSAVQECRASAQHDSAA